MISFTSSIVLHHHMDTKVYKFFWFTGVSLLLDQECLGRGTSPTIPPMAFYLGSLALSDFSYSLKPHPWEGQVRHIRGYLLHSVCLA